MKVRGAAVQGALAAVGLAAAFWAWQREPDAAGTEATVLDVSRSALTSLSYDDPKQTVVVTHGTEGGEAVTWLTVTTKDTPPPAKLLTLASDGGLADAGVPDAGPPPPPTPPVPKVRQYRGNDVADKLWERFSPMRAARALGEIDPAKLKDLGLDKPDRSLGLVAGGTRYDFEIGTAALGLVNPYFRAKDGKVYLLKGTLLSDLEFATNRLVDRRIHVFKLEEADELHVKAVDGAKEFVLLPDGKVAPKATPTAPDAFLKNWSDKVFRLVATDILGKGEIPPAGEPTSELRVEYLSHGKLTGWIDLGHSGPDVYARSEHAAGWIRLPANTGDVVAEAKKVVTTP